MDGKLTSFAKGAAGGASIVEAERKGGAAADVVGSGRDRPAAGLADH